MKMLKNKSGVALVTVLLFMLVATIAVTATYKWLSSEGRSSANRMLQEEARQSAIAGLNAAQAWMAYHGNETGAIIKQFLDQSNGGAPVKFGDALKELSKQGQNFSVWMVGADVSKHPYTIKIASQGESRNGTKHTEVGIMKVSGLYQVQIPTAGAAITFDQAFSGMHDGITGTDKLESGLITGDFTLGNGPKISSKLVVTGNAKYGTSVTQGGDFIVGGDFSADGSFAIGSESTSDTLVAYIGGDVTCPSGQSFEVYGDFLFDGSFSGCTDIHIHGNFTVNGNMDPSSDGVSGVKLEVDGDMVFTENGKMSYAGKYAEVIVHRNLYLPTIIAASCSDGDCGDGEGLRNISVDGHIFQYTGSSEYELLSNNNSAQGIYKEGTTKEDVENNGSSTNRITQLTGKLSNVGVSEWKKGSLKDVSTRYWKRIEKINAYKNLIVKDGSDAYIPQPILLNEENTWMKAKANTFCDTKTAAGADVFKSGKFSMSDDVIKKLNKCYIEAEKDGKVLYNGFLVVNWENDQKADPTELLAHKFIFYAKDKFASTVVLPATTENGVVFLYLKDGAGQILGLANEVYNYMIYAGGDIGEINGAHITGSVVMAKEKKLLKAQGGSNFEYKRTVVSAVASSGVIIDNPKFVELVNPDNGSSVGIVSSKQNDAYHISAAPQLLLEIESQYKNEETDDDKFDPENVVKPSVLVLPRILYLPVNPEGKLGDYYRSFNLNGAQDQFKEDKVSCSPVGVNYPNAFSSYDEMPEGVYTCEYDAGSYGKIPFYVVVKGRLGVDTDVSFEKRNQEIAEGVTAEVRLRVGASDGQDGKVNVLVSGKPECWELGTSGATLVSTSTNGDLYTVDVSPSSVQQLTTIFTLTMNGCSDQTGSTQFQLMEPCDECRITSPDIHTVTASGSFTIERYDISKYCADKLGDCSDYSDVLKALEDGAYCGSLIPAKTSVIFPDGGVNCSVLDNQDANFNNKWSCSIYIVDEITLKKQGSVNSFCDITIPKQNNSIGGAKVDEEKVLYASMTRKRLPLQLKLEGATNAKIEVTYSTDLNAEQGELQVKKDGSNLYGENTSFNVYAGYKYFFKVIRNGDKFAKWDCEGTDCSADVSTLEEYVIVPTKSNDVLTAVFNREDKHCFYEDFKTHENDDVVANRDFPSEFCNGLSNQTRCIDTCSVRKAQGESCSITDGKHYGKDQKPDWVMVYDNRMVTNKCPIDWSNNAECSKTDCSTLLLSVAWGCSNLRIFGQGVYSFSPLGCQKLYCSNSPKNGTSLLPPMVKEKDYIRVNDEISKGGHKANRSANSVNGPQSVVLSTKIAGSNGTMTSMFKTDVLSIFSDKAIISAFSDENLLSALPDSKYDFENSGFIFRSNANATKYYSLSIFGVNLTDKLIGGLNYSLKVYARLCLVSGQTATRDRDGTICETKVMETTNFGTDLTNGFYENSMFTLSLTVDGSLVDADMIIDRPVAMDKRKSIQFDLSKEPFNGNLLMDNEYVGMKLSNPKFRVYDISWQSKTYADECWSNPRLVCSFRSNHVGGAVQQNEDVSPWVSYSANLYENYLSKGCVLKYYYNGCDNTTTNNSSTISTILSSEDKNNKWNAIYDDYTCNTTKDGRMGTFWENGRPLVYKTGSSEETVDYFHFTERGKHGFAYSKDGLSGFAKDAKVILDCPKNTGLNPPSSLMTNPSCGEFYVGNIVPCENNVSNFLKPGEVVVCDGSCRIDVESADGVNLREATLKVDVENENDVHFQVSLIDNNGVESEPATILGSNGEISIDVTTIADALGFNPQEVKSVVFTAVNGGGSGSFKITSLQSSCPYALNLGSCEVSYTGVSWIINAEASNATECEIVSTNADVNIDKDEMGGSCSNTYQIRQPNLTVDKVDETYNFTVIARRKNSEGKILDEKKSECPPYTINPVEIECFIDAEEPVVMKGQGTPVLHYAFKNCPEGGCSYEISLEGSKVKGKTTGGGVQRFGNLNTVANPLSDGSYYYTISAHGVVSSACGFEVQSVKSTASAENTCSYDPDSKTFSANVSSEGYWHGVVNRVDQLGHVYAKTVKNYNGGNAPGLISVTVDDLREGDFLVFTVNGGGEGNVGCMVQYEASSAGGESGSTESGSTETDNGDAIEDVKLECPSNEIIVGSADGGGFKVDVPTPMQYCENGCRTSIVSRPDGYELSGNSAFAFTGGTLVAVDDRNDLSGNTKDYRLFVENDHYLDSCSIKVYYATAPSFSCEAKKYALTNTAVSFKVKALFGCNDITPCDYYIDDYNNERHPAKYENGYVKSEFVSSKDERIYGYDIVISNGIGDETRRRTFIDYFDGDVRAYNNLSNLSGSNDDNWHCYLVDIPKDAADIQCRLEDGKRTDESYVSINDTTLTMEGDIFKYFVNGNTTNSNIDDSAVNMKLCAKSQPITKTVWFKKQTTYHPVSCYFRDGLGNPINKLE